jgi:DNA-binding transcriptional MerR regulator
VSKGPDAFRTISEVADDLELPQHVLRFWETRFTQIKPLKRGGGRRYYRPDDVNLLRGIRHLLYGEGYTIRGVQRILHEQGQRFVVSAGQGELSGGEALGVVEHNGARHSVADGLGIAHGAAPVLAMLGQVDVDDEDEGAEATFDPRDFRPPAGEGEPQDSLVASDRLSNDEAHRLKSTLSELLELKRLLDNVR